MFDREIFDEVRKEFLSHLRYTRGHSPRTCYNYHSDLGIWAGFIAEAGKDWQRVGAADVEQFTAWQLRERGVGAHLVSRRLSCLSTFYRWAKKHEIVVDDPVYLADKPKRPHRIPVWLAREEQTALETAARRVDDIPDNIFGQKREHLAAIRQRYEVLFGLLLNSGLRITEALNLKVRDVGLRDGVARSLRVIGKGDRERLVPLPAAFGQTFGAWLQDRPAEEWVFAQRPQGRPPGAGAARAYLRRLKEMACIAKPLTPHKLRHTYATNRLNAGAELVDIKALLGHESISTTQIYTNVGQERMATVVNKL